MQEVRHQLRDLVAVVQMSASPAAEAKDAQGQGRPPRLPGGVGPASGCPGAHAGGERTSPVICSRASSRAAVSG